MLFVPARMHAQLSGQHAGAGGLSTVDEAALGDARLASVGLFLGSNDYIAGGGIGLAGGALRAYAGGVPQRRGARWTAGVGYARSIATRELTGPIRGIVGGELLGRVGHTPFAPHEAAAISLTAPVGVSFGVPSGQSLGLYAAPYAEAGVVRRWVPAPCAQGLICQTLGDVGSTHALGIGAGMRLSFGRFSAGILFGDVLERGPRLVDVGDTRLGFTYRLGE